MRILYLLGLVLLASCSSFRLTAHLPIPSPPPPSPVAWGLTASSGVRCADLVAQAMVTSDAVVHGVMDCVTPAVAASLGGWMPPIHSDQDFELQAATQPVFLIARYSETVSAADPRHPEVHDVIVYHLQNPSPAAGQPSDTCLGVYLTADQQVAAISFRTYMVGLC